jgi:hypothetical protein
MNTHPDPEHPAQRHDPQPTFPRIPLGLSPTPLHRLTGLMSAFDHGPELLAKREDLYGIAAGGNKILIYAYPEDHIEIAALILEEDGIAPTSQPGNSFLNSRSLAIQIFSDRVMNFMCRRSTMRLAGITAMRSKPSAYTITVLAISFPGI